MTKKLNPELIKTLVFISDFLDGEGYSPCLMEIAVGCDFSLGSANRYVKTLQDKFLIVKKDHTKRSIRLSDKGKEMLECLK